MAMLKGKIAIEPQRIPLKGKMRGKRKERKREEVDFWNCRIRIDYRTTKDGNCRRRRRGEKEEEE